MEAMGAFFDEEWDSLGKMFFSEDADFMLQLPGDGLMSNASDASSFFAAPSIFWPVNGGNENVAGVDGTLLCSDTLGYTNFHNFSQESSNSSASDGVFPNPSHELNQANNLFQVTNDTTGQSMDFYFMDYKNSGFVPVLPDSVTEDIVCPREEIMGSEKMGNAESQQPANIADSGNEILLKRKLHSSEIQTEAEDRTKGDSSENPKKKSRVARNAPKTKRNVQPKSKKNQKAKQISNEEDEPNTVQNGQSSSCYSSEDDSNASQEESNGGATSDAKGAALNLNGKTRATRGSATDPQSLYARRRRERINERLRILQNLIPNGTKVDISTMLEEAVHYVKFLQLQIKLLSSDDMWMYAPIVYNGLDIGLYGRIFPTL